MDTRRSFYLAPGQDDFAESAPDASRVNYNDIPYITAANDNFRVKGPFQGYREALLLGPCPVIGEIEALIDQGVDIQGTVLSGALTRMQQHVLDDRVGALAMLHDLVEVALQGVGDLADLCAQLVLEAYAAKRLAQFVDEFDRDR